MDEWNRSFEIGAGRVQSNRDDSVFIEVAVENDLAKEGTTLIELSRYLGAVLYGEQGLDIAFIQVGFEVPQQDTVESYIFHGYTSDSAFFVSRFTPQYKKVFIDSYRTFSLGDKQRLSEMITTYFFDSGRDTLHQRYSVYDLLADHTNKTTGHLGDPEFAFEVLFWTALNDKVPFDGFPASIREESARLNARRDSMNSHASIGHPSAGR